MTTQEIDNIFTYHKPNEDQIPRYEAIRKAGKTLAKTILSATPGCPDQRVAIRKVREAVMVANAAIAINE